MISMWSQMEAAWRSTMIHTANGPFFARLARLSQFIYQPGIKEGSWRRALLELTYGRRGSKGTTFDVVRHVFRQYDTLVEVDVDPNNPTVLTFVSSEGLTAFNHEHVGRYVSTPYGVMWSGGPVLCGGVGPETSATLELSPHTAADWVGAQWPFTVTTRMTVRLLPFLYYEMQQQPLDMRDPMAEYYTGNQCLIDVYFLDDIVPAVPATYLQDATNVLTPAGVPLGGQLVDDAFVVGDPLGDGPHPVYLVDDGAFAAIRTQVQRTLAAGVEIRFLRTYKYACILA